MSDPRYPGKTEQQKKDRVDHTEKVKEWRERDKQRDGKHDPNDPHPLPPDSNQGENWDAY